MPRGKREAENNQRRMAMLEQRAAREKSRNLSFEDLGCFCFIFASAKAIVRKQNDFEKRRARYMARNAAIEEGEGRKFSKRTNDESGRHPTRPRAVTEVAKSMNTTVQGVGSHWGRE